MSDELVVAVDIGGTTLKGALVDADRAIVHREPPVATPAAAGGRAVGAAVVDLVTGLAGRAGHLATPARVVAAGLVVPGRVEPATGTVRFAANLGWTDYPLGTVVSEALGEGLPVAVENDARAAGREEALATGRTDCLFVCLGTGVGSALVLAGTTRAGMTHLAGELGHVTVCRTGELCACGRRGCLERYASAAAVERRYNDQPDRTESGASAERVVGLLGTDPAADRVLAEAVDALASALATAVLLVDPGAIVLGGGLAEAGDALLGPLGPALASALTWRPAPQLVRATLGTDAGILGAARLAGEAGAVLAGGEGNSRGESRR